MLKRNRRVEVLDLRKSIGFIAIPEELLSELVRYLNNARAVRDKNIVGILERLLDLEKVGPDKIDGPLSELNRDLRRYQFRPWIVPHYDENWHTARWGLNWYSGRPGRDPMHTREALDMIFDLARAGHLSRLRRCAQCRNWLYARFRHQIFCSTKCQQKDYRETEAFKAHRRQYMRRRYYEQFPRRP
jgi:hypothetical protein